MRAPRQPKATTAAATHSAAERRRTNSGSPAAIAIGGRPAASGTGVVQRAITIRSQPVQWYTDASLAIAAAKKAGVDLESVRAVIERWVDDGLPHNYVSWAALLAGAKRRDQQTPMSDLPAGPAAAAEPRGFHPLALGAGSGRGRFASPASSPRHSPRAEGKSSGPFGLRLPVAAPAGSAGPGATGLDSPASSPRHSPRAAAAAAGGGESAGSASDDEGALAEHSDDGGSDPVADFADDLEGRQARLEARLARSTAAAGGAGAPAKKGELEFRKSTINYSAKRAQVGAQLGLKAKDLQTRKPHTKLGTGSSGTDHERADGDAAKRFNRKIDAEMKKRSGGANVKAADYMHGQERAAAAAAARGEKADARLQKEIETARAATEDYLDWLALIAPPAWRAAQEKRENTVRAAPTQKSRVKELKKLAEQHNWPKPADWHDGLGKNLFPK